MAGKKGKTLNEFTDAEFKEIERGVEQEIEEEKNDNDKKEEKVEAEEAQRAREQAEKEKAEQERKTKQYEDEAQRLRKEIVALVKEVGIEEEYRVRMKEVYGVPVIASLKNEDKVKEVAYLQGLKVQKEKEEEEKVIASNQAKWLKEQIISENEFTKLRDKMSLKDISSFYEWLKSEYDVTSFEALNLEDKRAVLEEMRKLIVTFEKKEEEKLKEKYGLQDMEERLGEEVEGKEEGIESVEGWDDGRVVTDEGAFLFRFVDLEKGLIEIKNEANGGVYALDITKPECDCKDFLINKRESELCKHLNAAIALGLGVKELPKLPAIPIPKPKEREKKKVVKEEVMALTVFDKDILMPVQVPTEIIKNEPQAVELIKGILGPNPKFDAVIEKYAGIEEISADVIISLAQSVGIRFMPLIIEEEKVRMNIGKVYLAVADEEQKRKYKGVADMMQDVDVVTRCRITMLAGWKDKLGDARIGMGTKEEVLTPFELADIAKRGSAFLRTKAETKAAKKAILNALPVTHDGLLTAIKRVYGW